MALTATATVRVMNEVAERLLLESPVVVRGDFRRPNLSLSVERVQSDKARGRRVVELVLDARDRARADAGRVIETKARLPRMRRVTIRTDCLLRMVSPRSIRW